MVEKVKLLQLSPVSWELMTTSFAGPGLSVYCHLDLWLGMRRYQGVVVEEEATHPHYSPLPLWTEVLETATTWTDLLDPSSVAAVVSSSAEG